MWKEIYIKVSKINLFKIDVRTFLSGLLSCYVFQIVSTVQGIIVPSLKSIGQF